MGSELNAKTKEGLSQEIKLLRKKCRDQCNVIEALDLDKSITPHNVEQKSLCYIDAVRVEIQKSDTRIPDDENLIISNYLAEMKEKTKEVDMLTAFYRGAILDVDNEIERLNNHVKIVEEAVTKKSTGQYKVQPEHLKKAKSNFLVLKAELHKLIQSVFPNNNDAVMDIIKTLMEERLNEESSGYIPVTPENFKVIELLKDINIVTENPYNKMEVKLAF